MTGKKKKLIENYAIIWVSNTTGLTLQDVAVGLLQFSSISEDKIIANRVEFFYDAIKEINPEKMDLFAFLPFLAKISFNIQKYDKDALKEIYKDFYVNEYSTSYDAGGKIVLIDVVFGKQPQVE